MHTQSLINPLPPSLCCPDAGFEQFRMAEKAHGSWMKLYLEGNTSEVLTNMGKKVLRQYLEALTAMSSALSKQLGKYDMYSMVAGMVFVFQVSPGFPFDFESDTTRHFQRNICGDVTYTHTLTASFSHFFNISCLHKSFLPSIALSFIAMF